MIGTAGHVDHGKTRLVRLLTGCETDRLKIEKERGLSIELGFAPCRIGDGLAAGIVDVPGHEQFIKNMVAGATGMDMAILLVAADDGVMPQTIEHLQIMQFLGVQYGLVALSKIDLVSSGRVEEVRREIEDLCAGTFLEGAPICPFSSETGEGFDRFYDTLVATATRAKIKRQEGVFRMPVERVFSVPGHGTVVTGIPLAGKVLEGDLVEVQPSGKRARVRGMQRFLREASEGHAGQCLALNLAGLPGEAVERGHVVGRPGYVRPCTFLQVFLTTCDDLSSPLEDGEEVRLHTGTLEVQGRLSIYGKNRLERGQQSFGAIRPAEPIATSPTDRFVIRRNSPTITVAGGVILRALDYRPKGTRADLEEELKARWESFSNPESRVEYHFRAAGAVGSTIQDAAVESLLEQATVEKVVRNLVEAGRLFTCSGDRYIHEIGEEDAKRKIGAWLERYHSEQPSEFGPTLRETALRLGLPEPIVSSVTDEMLSASEIEKSENRISLVGRHDRFDSRQQDLLRRIESMYRETRYTTPRPDELPELLHERESTLLPLLDYLCQRGTLVRLGKNVVFPKAWMEEAERLVVAKIRETGELDSGDFKTMIDSTRKYALAILDHLDVNHVTQRSGNIRRLHPGYLRKCKEPEGKI
jgi:selenocysteine-specific elongation factor